MKELVPERYHDFLDVFSKEKGESLPDHTDHDLRVNFIPDSTPPFGGIYRLASQEQSALKAYIDDMLAKGLIRSQARERRPRSFHPEEKR